jgi:deoxyribonuclease IV
MRIGGHVRGGVQGGVAHAREIGAETIQIFAGSPQTWRAPSHSDAEVDGFRGAVEDHDVGPVFVHGVYIANLASPKPSIRHMSISAVAGHLDWASRLGAAGLIIHPGSAGSEPLDEALERVVKGLRRVLDQVDGPAQLLLECCAGQGATIGRRFAELDYIIRALDGDSRLGWVLDTCHAFNAGYELTTEDGFASMVAEIEATVGFERLAAIHANDSKTPFAAQVDRHENIGEGHIGDDAFARLLQHPAFADVPQLLEVPGYDRKGPDRANVERLCRLAGRDPRPLES